MTQELRSIIVAVPDGFTFQEQKGNQAYFYKEEQKPATPSITDIYPNGYKVPEGWVEVGFQQVKLEDNFISHPSGFGVLLNRHYFTGDWRVVVRRLTPEDVYGEKYKIPEGWERVGGDDFRVPKKGEYYLERNGRYVFEADMDNQLYEGHGNGYRLILRPVVQKITLSYSPVGDVEINGVRYRRVDA